MICRRHAETDQALDFCQKHSLLLALDSETPQDQLKVASGVVIDTLRVWRDDVKSHVDDDDKKKNKKSPTSAGSPPFSDNVFGTFVPDHPESNDSQSTSPPSSSSSSSTFGKPVSSNGAGSREVSSDNQQQQGQHQQPATVFRGPNYFFSVGFLRLRRLAHSRFRLRDILRRYMSTRRAFIAAALEQWRELELSARISVSFDEYVLVYVPPALRRQVLVDFHAACCHQTMLFIRATRIGKEAEMQLRKTFYLWAYHQRKTSSATFRISLVTMLIFQERARKRAWVRKLLGNVYAGSAGSAAAAASASSTASSSHSSPSSPAFGKNSRVASLLIAGCTAPTRWCQSLLSLQSLAWCCAIRRHTFQTEFLDRKAAFVYSDLLSKAKQIEKKQNDIVAGGRPSTSPSSSASSSSASLSSLCSSTEGSVELSPSRLALCFAPWVNAEVTATWFSIHLQKFAIRQLAGAHKASATLLTKTLREQQQQQGEESVSPSSSNRPPSAPSNAETSVVTSTVGLWHKVVISTELFSPFSFVDLAANSDEQSPVSKTFHLTSLASPRRSNPFSGFGAAVDAETKRNLEKEYVFRGRRAIDEEEAAADTAASSRREKLSEEALQEHLKKLNEQNQQQQQQSLSVELGADGALVSSKKKTVQIDDDVHIEESSPKGDKRKQSTTTTALSPLSRRRQSMINLREPTQGQLLSQQHLREHRRAEFDYAHNFSFLDDADGGGGSPGRSKGGWGPCSPGGTALARSRSARMSISAGSGGGGGGTGMMLPTASFRRRLTIRSASLRLPTAGSFRIKSAFSAIAAGQRAAPETGLAPTQRCPTLWGTAWLTDPHWGGAVDGVETLWLNAEAQSLYRRVLGLCIQTGALRITDPWLAQRLERVNQRMVAARMLEGSGQQQQQQQRLRSSSNSKKKKSKSDSPLPLTRRERKQNREEESGRMMWTPRRTREPTVVCELFGQISTVAPGDDMLVAKRHEAVVAVGAPEQPLDHKQQQQPQPQPRSWTAAALSIVSSSSSSSASAAAPASTSTTAPVFFPQARPSTPRLHGLKKQQRVQAERRRENVAEEQERTLERAHLAAQQQQRMTAAPPSSTAAANANRNPQRSVFVRRSTQHQQQQQRAASVCSNASGDSSVSSSSTTRIVTVDDAIRAAEEERCATVAPAPPPQKRVRAIVRGAAANRRAPYVPVPPLAERQNNETMMAVAASARSAATKGDNIGIQKCELHQRADQQVDWTSTTARPPSAAPHPFGFNVGFPAIAKVLGIADGQVAPPKYV